jgi:hypothetical protein
MRALSHRGGLTVCIALMNICLANACEPVSGDAFTRQVFDTFPSAFYAMNFK